MAEIRYKNTNEPVITESKQGEKPKTAVAVAYEPGERAPKIIAAGKGMVAEKIIEKAKEAEIEATEKKVSDLKDRISRMVREYGYPDGQAFMAAYNKAESIVKRYEWELAEWKQQVEGKPAEEKKPPERKSVLEQLHRIRDEAQKPQKRSCRDRDER